jgi:hypothetical protein
MQCRWTTVKGTLPPIAPRVSEVFTKGITKGASGTPATWRVEPEAEIPRADIRTGGLRENRVDASEVDLQAGVRAARRAYDVLNRFEYGR